MSGIPSKLIELLKTYFQQLVELHRNKDAGNEVYQQLAADEEERQDIAELCTEIDLYYEERANQKRSGLSAFSYLEREVTALYKAHNPDATDEDCDQCLREMRADLDKVLLKNAEYFFDEGENGEEEFREIEAASVVLDEKGKEE